MFATVRAIPVRFWFGCYCSPMLRPVLLFCSFLLSGLLILLSVAMVCAGDAVPQESLYLRSGTMLPGRSQSVINGQLRWEVSPGEILLVPVDTIERIDLAGATAAPNDVSPPITAPPVEVPTLAPKHPETVVAEQPERWLHVRSVTDGLADWYEQLESNAITWTRRIQFGGTFVDGNSKTDLIDVATELERNTPQLTRQIDAGGQWAKNGTKQTANRWFLNTNFDRPISAGSQWITFATSKNEYNELQHLDYRGTLSTGVGYRFFFEPKRRLIARLGPAYTVEFFNNPVDRRDNPDLFGEVELRWPIFTRTSFEQKMRVQPSLLNSELVRVFSTTGLLMDLDERERWKLRLGFQYNYNSQPNVGRLPSDYITTVSLIYLRK